ncbi:MAG TPA: peptide chain release factor N(5)-glutamine methyltransferase [Pyrinomonadaceae bacterium]
MTVLHVLDEGEVILRAASIPDPRKEASSLLQFAIGRERSFIVAHPEYGLTEEERHLFQRSVERRASREPFQHIVGRQEFYGLDFIVTPDVLIPRHETELIVEKAIELLIDERSPRFLEIGIGSGCISIAILKNSPRASAIAVDISEPAIEIAKRNASMHAVNERLEIIRSDVYEKVPNERFDLIVANPPYVPLEDYAHLQPEVRDHDPRIAVTDGSTGLTVIERIVADAPSRLRSDGHLLMEIGFGQHERVSAMFDRNRWKGPDLIPDLQGIPRVVFATLRQPHEHRTS